MLVYKDLQNRRKIDRMWDEIRVSWGREYAEYLNRLAAGEITENGDPVIHNWKREGF
jgi:hypothetical protein